MTKIALLITSLAGMLVALLPATPARAQNTKSFVSSTGSGTACTFTAPCANFQTAHNATAPAGEIDCLDSGDFFALTITKSIVIDCAGTAASTNQFTVNGAGINVTIRNLTFFTTNTGLDTGISFFNGAALVVEHCLFYANPTAGINFQPTAAGAKLVVTDTVINNNGVGSTGGGIVVSPFSGGTAQVALNRVTVAANVFGIAVDGSQSTGGINMTITDSVSSGNSQDGIVATTPAGGAPIAVMITNSKSINNGFGIRSIGAGVTVRVENSKVIGNGTGVTSLNGGGLVTFGNNVVRANGSDGGFTAAAGLQ
jgi:hypothetical protein